MDLKNPTRTESLLANIAGYTGVPVPDMKNATRSERLLKEILDNGGGGGGGDVTKEYVDTAIANAVADIDDDISALSDTVADKVDKVNGKSLSTNDYTDADKALVQDSPITVTATVSPIPTANGKPRAITIYGKSEIVDGVIKSAGEGYAVVRLADLTWVINSQHSGGFQADITTSLAGMCGLLCDKYSYNDNIDFKWANFDSLENKTIYRGTNLTNIFIKDTDYTTVSDFVASLGDATLCYQLADPTQGNAIAVKTDDGSGVDGTMAVFETGTPLYGISDTVRDVMTWDGTSGEVSKICGEIDLGTLMWDYVTNIDPAWAIFRAQVPNMLIPSQSLDRIKGLLCPLYPIATQTSFSSMENKSMLRYNGNIVIKDNDFTDAETFKSAMNGVKLIYELATPTTTPLTTTENESIAGLKTYSPSTTVTINDASDYSIEAYANTPNGQVVSNMQPTRSPLLTLTASGWTNNAQTVTYEHNTGKRNSIDVEPASIKAWTAAGILATAETATSITFECDTAPTADLSFRVTSMEVR